MFLTSCFVVTKLQDRQLYVFGLEVWDLSFAGFALITDVALFRLLGHGATLQRLLQLIRTVTLQKQYLF